MLRRLFTILSLLSLLAFVVLIAKWAFLRHTPLAAWSAYADADLHCRCIMLVDGQIVMGGWHATPRNIPPRGYTRLVRTLRQRITLQSHQDPTLGLVWQQQMNEKINQVEKELPLEYELGLRGSRGLHAGISHTLGQSFSPPNNSVPLLWEHAGVTYHRAFYSSPSSRKLYVRLAISIWMIAALLLLLPLWRGLPMLRVIRRRRSLCPTCSYDLRAHHPGDRCPECGTPVPPRPTSAP